MFKEYQRLGSDQSGSAPIRTVSGVSRDTEALARANGDYNSLPNIEENAPSTVIELRVEDKEEGEASLGPAAVSEILAGAAGGAALTLDDEETQAPSEEKGQAGEASQIMQDDGVKAEAVEPSSPTKASDGVDEVPGEAEAQVASGTDAVDGAVEAKDGAEEAALDQEGRETYRNDAALEAALKEAMVEKPPPNESEPAASGLRDVELSDGAGADSSSESPAETTAETERGKEAGKAATSEQPVEGDMRASKEAAERPTTEGAGDRGASGDKGPEQSPGKGTEPRGSTGTKLKEIKIARLDVSSVASDTERLELKEQPPAVWHSLLLLYSYLAPHPTSLLMVTNGLMPCLS